MSRVIKTLGSLRSVQRGQARLRSTVAAVNAADVESRPVEWASALPYESIPGLKQLPLLGITHMFMPVVGKFYGKQFPDIFNSLAEIAPMVKFGRILGKPDMLILFDPADVENVFRNEGVWPIRELSDSLNYYFRYVRKNQLVSLATSQGEEWQKFRTAVNQVMMQPRNTKQYVEPIDVVAQEFVDRIKEIRDDKNQLPDTFVDEIAKWSLESITYVALDTRLGLFYTDDPNSEAAQMIACVRSVFDAMYKLDLKPSPWKWIPTPAFRQMMNSMETFTKIATKHVNAAMERLQKAPEGELKERQYSVLENLLLSSKDPSSAVAMALDMLLAGVDTTSMVAATVMYQLAIHPEKQLALQAELDRVIPDPSKATTKEQLEELKYLRACIKETMRVMPILLGTMRTTTKDMVIQGYQVPKGTRMSINQSMISNDNRYFPRANEFLPERWLRGHEELKPNNPFSFLPFGFGPRMCVGKRFADLEIETLIAKVFRNFDLQWEHPPVETDFKLLLTFKSPLKFTMKDRS